MLKIGVYVKGDALTPARFWSYALVTDLSKECAHIEQHYVFCQKSTDLYVSLSEQEKLRVHFTYINNEKQTTK